MLTAMERSLLHIAKAQIQSGAHHAICSAISAAAIGVMDRHGSRSSAYRYAHHASRRLRDYIQRELEEHAYLESWQRMRGIHRNPDQVRQDRIDWIDWMLTGTLPKRGG